MQPQPTLRTSVFRIAVAVVSLLLTACDGSLTVSGQLKAESCELSLWAMRGPIWAEARPTKLRSAKVGDGFDVHWIIGGPRSDHWVEVACPGYRTFRSPTFRAPSSEPVLKLGRVTLEPEQPDQNNATRTVPETPAVTPTNPAQ